MKQFFVPFSGDQPACTIINGHRLIVITQDRSELQELLEFFGGDRVEPVQVDELDFGDDTIDQSQFEHLAESVGGGVVVAPNDIGLLDVVKNLESELPWVQ